MTWEGALFRLETAAFTSWHRWTGRRPLSLPYLSGDAFRSLCTVEFDPSHSKDFSAERVPAGALVYCRGDHLRTFLVGPAGKIPGPFFVLSHNDDTNLTSEWPRLFPENLVRMFAQNAVAGDPRIVPLPIGLENAVKHYNGVIRDYERLRRSTRPELNRILVAFTDGTNPAVRGPARRALAQSDFADASPRTNSRTYRKRAVHYRFVASPPGNGEDCHRTWEALYLRSVPIVLRSPMTEAFERIGLPLWLVESYEELQGMAESDLEKKYIELEPRFDHPALWFPFWSDLVLRSLEVPGR